MSAGDTYWFAPYFKRVLDFQSADFGATPNQIYMALIPSEANGGLDPTAATPWPTWGAAGTTDLSALECTPGGNYPAGGVESTLPETSVTDNVVSVDWENPPTISQNGSNPTNARWAIFYDFTSANKDCICFVDLGTDSDLTTGELEITMGAPALTIVCDSPPLP